MDLRLDGRSRGGYSAMGATERDPSRQVARDRAGRVCRYGSSSRHALQNRLRIADAQQPQLSERYGVVGMVYVESPAGIAAGWSNIRSRGGARTRGQGPYVSLVGRRRKNDTV